MTSLKVRLPALLCLAALCWWPSAAPAAALAPLPAFSGYVVDLAGALPEADRTQLTARLKDLEQRKGAQLAVLVVQSTAPEQIEQYGIRLARHQQRDGRGEQQAVAGRHEAGAKDRRHHQAGADAHEGPQVQRDPSLDLPGGDAEHAA